jgi:hypothetical protein
MKHFALLLVTLFVPSAIAKEQPTEPKAVVITLDDEATFEYLPPVEVSAASNEIEVVSCYDAECVELNY